MSDKVYKDSSIPDEYNILAYDDTTLYFFKENNYNECYTQKYIQGAYVIDYIYNPSNYTILSTFYETSNDYVYRADISHIFIIYFCLFFLLMLGVNIVTRVVHRKGLL